MSAQTANSQFPFQLPSLSYIDAKWEEPNLRTQTTAPSRVRRRGLAAWLSGLATAFVIWRQNSIAAAELDSMSDYELRDIGLNRSDVPRVFDPALNFDLRRRGIRG